MTQLYLLSAPQARALPRAFGSAWFPERLARAERMPPDAAALPSVYSAAASAIASTFSMVTPGRMDSWLGETT